jgi:glycosyltransferase involved in cell wall biosynthesis
VKILVLANLYPPHHAGTFDFRCQRLSDALALRGHTVRVLTSRHGLTHEQRSGAVERRLGLNGAFGHEWVTRFKALRALEEQNHRAFQETLAEFKPDLIHVFSLTGLSKSLIFAVRNSHVPAVYDVADGWLVADLRQDPWLRWWNRPGGPALETMSRNSLELLGQRAKLDALAPTRLMPGYDRLPEVFGSEADLARVKPNSISAFRFDRLYFCSHALREAAAQAGFRVNHAEVIYPGIPAEQYVGEPKPPSAPLHKFLLIAELIPRSGAHYALQALSAVLSEHPRTTLSIYGHGESSYIADLRSFVAQHKLPVDFLAVSNINRDLPPIYRSHDALLHTTEWEEPFAMTPLEAMACGLPVIGVEAGGVSELFRHEENALTYPPGDVTTLANHMLELQRNATLRCRIADTAQQDVLSKFNETAVTDRIENYLQTSLEVWSHAAT